MICNNCVLQEHSDCDNRTPKHRAEMPPSWCDCHCREHKARVAKLRELADLMVEQHGEILDRLGKD